MKQHEHYMQQCLSLAIKGFGKVAPNPMVGCVIVNNGKVIGEGFHELFGEPHAEINAINSVKNTTLIKNSELYVSLEPCSHYGKTPPCADAIIKHGIKRVVIGSVDPNPVVRGKGIKKLIDSGCDVVIGALEKECMELNKRFFTFYHEKRPYIILKWAQTTDGFIDKIRTKEEKPASITGAEANKLSHIWRSDEQAIMVGTNTVVMDNPHLTTRLVKGRSPIRIFIDRNLKITPDANIFSNFAGVIVFNGQTNKTEGNIEYIKVNFNNKIVGTIVTELYKRTIQSVIIEGGRSLLTSFIEAGIWDEARVFYSDKIIGKGVESPIFNFIPAKEAKVGNDILKEFRNKY